MDHASAKIKCPSISITGVLMRCLTALFFASAMLAAPAYADVIVNVPGLSDLYLAGQTGAVSCCAGDKSPTESPVLALSSFVSGEYLTFSTTGGANYHPSASVYPTADGDSSFLYTLTHDYGTGISGPSNVHLAGLAGVFLDSNTPSGPAPASLTGTDFSSIAPGLDQIFFIGDGLTGTGTGSTQTFYVPTGATRLYLGLIDDGGYYDNVGTINASIATHAPSVTAVPEPFTFSIFGAGIVSVAATRRRNKKLKAPA